MKPSEIIIQKLSHEPNQVAHIRQLNKHMTNLYFVEKNTFWSDHLNKLMGKGYRFDMFDILAEESNRFPDRKIPKGNARKFKLGDPNCDINSAIGILGYYYYQKKDGESLFEPIHVIAAILEWAGIAKNLRGYIQFINN